MRGHRNAVGLGLTPGRQASVELGIDPQDWLMVFAGRLHPNKGLSDLLTALAKLPEALAGRRLQLIALGALIAGGALHGQPCQELGDSCKTIEESWMHLIGLSTLWAAAVLTCITGWDYLRVGLKHMD